MNSARSLVISIAQKITLPEVYHRIRQLIATADVTIDDFVEVINMDATLAVHIVEIVNSDFLGYGRKSDTVKQALSLIGVVQLHDLLLSSLAIRAFAGIPSALINQEAFWRSSVFCGMTARLLAKKGMLPAAERLFALGLLHEIGHLVMYAKIPEKIQDVLIDSHHSDRPLYVLEREKLGFDYGQVGSEIMRIWHLPDSYSVIARYHMEPEKSQDFQQEIAIVNLARSMMLAEDINSVQPINSFLDSLNESLQTEIDMDDIETIAVKARLHVDEILSCLMMRRKSRL